MTVGETFCAIRTVADNAAIQKSSNFFIALFFMLRLGFEEELIHLFLVDV